MGLQDHLRRTLAKCRVPKWRLRPEILCLPNIPKPMHGVVPRSILGREWWDKERQRAFASTGQHCIACGVFRYSAKEHQWLEGHEVYDIDYLLGRLFYIETVPLCNYCHCYIHDGRMQALLDRGKVTKQKFNAVVHHGNKVLRAAGIARPIPYTGPTADWEDWRLVLYGVEHPPAFKSFEEWKAHFNGVEDD